MPKRLTAGFTLIELSIVLVIIGLIVGGILVGQDLIRAAEIRSTIAQIEKYHLAVAAFRGKYNALPGDINKATAAMFGFTARGLLVGEGDGNFVLQSQGGSPIAQNVGETVMFWVDLTTAGGQNINLIEGAFSTASATVNPGVAFTLISTPSIYDMLPTAKLGRGNFIYAYSNNSINYFGLSVATNIAAAGRLTSTPGLTVQQAYSIDKKMDDGFAAGGAVQANYVTANAVTASSNNSPAGTTDCYDSTNINGDYALSAGTGSRLNCALSFQFQ